MMLPILFLLPAAAGLLLLLLGRRAGRTAAATVALAALAADLGLAVVVLGGGPADFQVPWFQNLGSSFHLAADGLASLLVVLTLLLSILAAAMAGREIAERPAAYQGLLLLTGAGLVAGFLAADLFLFSSASRPCCCRRRRF